tara:strand:+ start:491 stop:706 length:216 start_codon:yes stop_codon:yes gene_type:complete
MEDLNIKTLEIKAITYDQPTNKVLVECYFKEENSNFIHSRTYTFNNESGEDLVYADVVELMRTDDFLNSLL